MKRILSFALVLSLLGGTSLWALRGPVNGRTYNRDVQELRGQNQTYWVKAVGEDADGLLSTNIEVVVDYEYFTEDSWPPGRKGYDYYAYAKVWGAGTGTWSVYTSVPHWLKGTDSDSAGGLIGGDVYRYVDSSGFQWDLGAPNAVGKLSNCSANANLSAINEKSTAKRW